LPRLDDWASSEASDDYFGLSNLIVILF